jgi:hypothetical protein
VGLCVVGADRLGGDRRLFHQTSLDWSKPPCKGIPADAIPRGAARLHRLNQA